MKTRTETGADWLLILQRLGVILLAAVLLAAASGGSAAGARQAPFEPEPGEIVMNRSCLGCHDVRNIQVQAMDADEWEALIGTMIDNGAEVAEDEIPPLIDYLVRRHGPLPEGEGRDILRYSCTVCHDLDRVLEHRVSPEHWQETLFSMLNEGAYLSDEEFYTLLGYLALHFSE